MSHCVTTGVSVIGGRMIAPRISEKSLVDGTVYLVLLYHFLSCLRIIISISCDIL